MEEPNLIACVEPVLRPLDKNAVEAALRIREKRGGRVTLLAPASGEEKLRDGLAMGCDRAVLLRPGTPAGLAAAVRKLGRFDLVLVGEAGDRLAGMAARLGELLRVAHLGHVTGLEVRSDGGVLLTARRGTWRLLVQGRLPLVLGVHRDLNTPRLTSLSGILAAAARPVEQWDLAVPGQPLSAGHLPAPRREMLAGEPETVVRRLVEVIRGAVQAGTSPDDYDPRLRVVSVERDMTAVPLEEAAIVVAGGWGVGGGANWRLLEELARLLGGAVGCTRPAVDEGWAPEEAMIGTSGLKVQPDLYLGIGLSGDPHHLAGLLGAGLIIAVNRNPAAPVFQYADYGVTADCREILPLLVAGLRAAL